MLQNQSFILPCDRCGLWALRVFHTYTKLSRLGFEGSFVNSSSRVVSRSNWMLKGRKYRSLVISSVWGLSSTSRSFGSNSGLTLNKSLTPLGRRVGGPISSQVIRKRAIASFLTII